jgi:hypothetical protein
MAYAEKGDKNMADPKNAAKNKKRTDKNDEKPTGYKSGQGNMGAESLARKTWGARSPQTMKIWAVRSQTDQKNRRLFLRQFIWRTQSTIRFQLAPVGACLRHHFS